MGAEVSPDGAKEYNLELGAGIEVNLDATPGAGPRREDWAGPRRDGRAESCRAELAAGTGPKLAAAIIPVPGAEGVKPEYCAAKQTGAVGVKLCASGVGINPEFGGVEGKDVERMLRVGVARLEWGVGLLTCWKALEGVGTEC